MENKPLLEGILVIELASVLAGPSVGMFLAELGARVIKIENFSTGGDVTRSWKSSNENPSSDISAYFSSVNWGKESICLNLSKMNARIIVHQMVQHADIVIASYKKGDAEKLEMDPMILMGINPKLIYAKLSAYGEDDERTGFDAIIQAEAGFTYMNGTSASGPVKMPVALMDLLAAHQLKEGILAALYKREKTGMGSFVQTDLLSSGIASLANQASNWLMAKMIPQRMGSGHPNIVPYGTIFNTADEKGIVLAIGNDHQFKSLCEILDLKEMSVDPLFATNISRVKNREETERRIAEKILNWTSEKLLQVFREAKIPAGAIHNMKEVFDQPQGKSLLLESENAKGVRTVAFSLGDPLPPRLLSAVEVPPPPSLGKNTKKILSELCNYSDEMIDAFIKDDIAHDGN